MTAKKQCSACGGSGQDMTMSQIIFGIPCGMPCPHCGGSGKVENDH